MIVVWIYIMIATLLEATASYMIPMNSWTLHDSVIGIVAISAAAIVVMYYMELRYRPRWESAILGATLFFVADLLLIWTASLAH
jgi:uncharacterized membrane protein YhfC